MEPLGTSSENISWSINFEYTWHYLMKLCLHDPEILSGGMNARILKQVYGSEK